MNTVKRQGKVNSAKAITVENLTQSTQITFFLFYTEKNRQTKNQNYNHKN